MKLLGTLLAFLLTAAAGSAVQHNHEAKNAVPANLRVGEERDLQEISFEVSLIPLEFVIIISWAGFDIAISFFPPGRALADNEQCAPIANPNESTTDIARSLYNNMDSGDDIRTSDLVAVYMAQGFDEHLAKVTAEQMDANKDGVIDANELAQVEIPDAMVEYVFDEILTCSDHAADDNACVSTEDTINFINNLFGATVIDESMASHIADQAGADKCFTKEEMKAYHAPTLAASSSNNNGDDDSRKVGLAVSLTVLALVGIVGAIFYARK